MNMKKLWRMSSVFEFSISKLGYIWKCSWKSETVSTICLMKVGKKMNLKMKMSIKKFGRMSFISKSYISKLGSMAVFMKIWEKIFDPFLRHFWKIGGKMKMKMKKYGKISSIFKFSIPKLGYLTIFVKKKFFLTYFFRHFWLIEAKMKMKIKKFEKVTSIFEFFISKLGFLAIFMKIGEKKFWPIF